MEVKTTCKVDDLTFIVSAKDSISNTTDLSISADIEAPFGGQIEFYAYSQDKINIYNAIKDGTISLKLIEELESDLELTDSSDDDDEYLDSDSDSSVGEPSKSNSNLKEKTVISYDLELKFTYKVNGELFSDSIMLQPDDDAYKNLLEYREYLKMCKELESLRIENATLNAQVAKYASLARILKDLVTSVKKLFFDFTQ